MVLVLVGLTPRTSKAQVSSPQTPPRQSVPVGGLGGAFPNPMNPETHISFTVGNYPTCDDSGRLHSVSMVIKNTLAQPIAIPVIEGGSGNVAGGQQINKLQLPCGAYKAYWNGKVLNTQREAASGVYIVELVVDGHRFSFKLTVAK